MGRIVIAKHNSFSVGSNLEKAAWTRRAGAAGLCVQRRVVSGALQCGSLRGEPLPDGDAHAEQHQRERYARGDGGSLQGQRLPPASRSTIATSPSKIAQNTRCGTGASTLPPAVIVSITSEPELDEVTKNTTTRTMPMNDEIAASGRPSSMMKSCNSSDASAIALEPCSMIWLRAAVPKVVIHNTQTADGISSTQIRNSRTVLPRETRAMNMPTKGDHDIHHAQ